MSHRTNVIRANAVRYVATMQQLRRSSATSPHDPRPRRQRSRSDALRAAVREYSA